MISEELRKKMMEGKIKKRAEKLKIKNEKREEDVNNSVAKEEKIEKKEDLLNVLTVVSELADSVKSLSERINKIEKPEIKIEQSNQMAQMRLEINEKRNEMIPVEWNKIVDEILGNDFNFDIIPLPNGDFQLKITVPAEWDCRIGDEHIMMKADVRSGLVRRITPIADIQYWCQKIKDNIQKKYLNFRK